MRTFAILCALACLSADSALGFDLSLPRVAERTCTLVLTKVKKDKKERVTTLQGYRRTDSKKSRFELEVTWKKLDAESREVLADAEKGTELRVVYAWGFTGRYLVKAREFTEKDKQTEDTKVAAGDVEETDDADADDNEGEKAAGKPVTDGAEQAKPRDDSTDDEDDPDAERN